MTLHDFLDQHSLTETKFAAQIGVDQSTVHRLRAKGQVPTKPVMERIFEQTGGLVTANDFFGIAA